jgi:ABC-2 type transport system permease protein
MRVMYMLWLRQMKRYTRSRSRILGAIGQPVLFLLALGYGLGTVFKKADGGNYLQFLVPGIIVQTILFAGVFWGVQIVWDRQFGFLKETLVAPVPRWRIMMGSALGGATIALIQGLIVLIISLIFGFRPHDWSLVPLGILIAAITALAMACFGSGIGSIVQDFQGFQGINNFLVLPMYFLSGAFYPLAGIPKLLQVISYANPLSYAIDGLRGVLTNQHHFSYGADLGALTLTTFVMVAFGVYAFRKLEA